MRLIFVIALTVLALYVLISSLIKKRGNGVPWIIIIALLTPAGVAGWFEWRWQQEMNYISENIVAKITGDPESRLNCQRMFFAFGDAESSEYLFDAGEKNIGIKYGQCSQILDYYRNTDEPKPAPTPDQVKALNILASEAVRIAGEEKDPAKIACLGNKNIGFIVAQLGGSERDGNLAAYKYQKETLDKDLPNNLQCFNS